MGSAWHLVPVLILLGACAQQGAVVVKAPAETVKSQPQIEPPRPEAVASPVEKPDPMVDVQGDKPLPALQGAGERLDCTTGTTDLQARMGFEARGGQVTYFAFYSKINRRTCSLELMRNASGTKWRLMADGATRVQMPEGHFVIRSRSDAYVFEFQNIARQKFCGMSGEINGTMTVKRGAGKPECSVTGILDANN
jgi:hypothetical protein